MSQPVRLRWIFSLCAALVLLAMGWATRTVLKGERAAAQAQAVALQDARVRAVLWRMDGTVGRFLQSEQARPPRHYHAFHTPDGGGRLEPSPLLLREDELVLLRFQTEATGLTTSPQVPQTEHRSLATRLGVDPQRLATAQARLATLHSTYPPSLLAREILRQGGFLVSREEILALRRQVRPDARIASPFETNVGAFTPLWMGKELFLVRQVWIGDHDLLQGCWMDWQALREVLLSEVAPDLRGGTLEPVTPGSREGHVLSTLPLRFRPHVHPQPAPRPQALLVALGLAWAATLLAMAGGALLLQAAIRFGERRAAFVSAVTHELRTPLTTFRLYAEMLVHGMVPDPEEQRGFLRTLLLEAERLDHLVRNVLSFSRLEARRGAQREVLPLAVLLDRLLGRLRQRADQAGRPLVLDLPAPLEDRRLETDPALVEQVLFNLVDNACKYATPAEDPTLHLDVLAENRHLILRVRDHGPGLPAALVPDLWRPFHRSGQAAAGSAPGVGLGLALCHRLARSLGGSLTLDADSGPGAAFRLSLPATDQAEG